MNDVERMEVPQKPYKPIGRKNCGSIPHLQGSRIGPGDHHCHEGQQRICTAKIRDKYDRVIVTEKLDGSNVGVALTGGRLWALQRTGYPAESSPFEQHKLFAQWVWMNQSRFLSVLNEGERFVGEWLAQAHGTRYRLLHEPLVVFDLIYNDRHLAWDVLVERCSLAELTIPHVISDNGSRSIEDCMVAIGTSFHGALDPVEGAVWRVEREGKFDFMAKYLRSDKLDGCYLPEVSGKEAVWNWRPGNGVK